MTALPMTAAVRRPEVAGTFYPADADECAALVAQSLAGARPAPPGEPKVLVVPHAGHVYSGAIAGTAYAPLTARRERLKRVVMLGPAHRAGFRGLATTSVDAWASPLGTVPVDAAALKPLLARAQVRAADAAFAREHSLEVQLPFLQRVLERFGIVPILVGEAGRAEVAEVLEALWGGPETLILISSDLSHFHDYETARRLDAGTAKLVELMQPEKIDAERACGYRALGGALDRARALDLRVTALDLRNSGDTRGGRDRVVGYGAFAMEYADSARLAEGDRARLLDAARASLAFGADKGRPMRAGLDADLPPALRAMRASFVTLRVGGRLRGCRGSMAAREPLLLDVVANAYRAGFEDPRFGQLRVDELADAALGVAVLSTPRPIPCADENELLRQLRPDVDGLVLQEGEKRGLFLPGVWASVPEPARFVRQLKRKAGLAADHWPADTRAFRFTAESFSAPFRAA